MNNLIPNLDFALSHLWETKIVLPKAIFPILKGTIERICHWMWDEASSFSTLKLVKCKFWAGSQSYLFALARKLTQNLFFLKRKSTSSFCGIFPSINDDASKVFTTNPIYLFSIKSFLFHLKIDWWFYGQFMCYNCSWSNDYYKTVIIYVPNSIYYHLCQIKILRNNSYCDK